MVRTRHQLDSDDEARYESFLSITRSTRRSTGEGHRKYNGVIDDSSDEEMVQTRHSQRKQMQAKSGPRIVDSSQHDGACKKKSEKNLSEKNVFYPDGGRRRSTRSRKLVYATLNQSTIDKHMMIGDSQNKVESSDEEVIVPRSKRIRYEDDNDNDGLDMYSRVKRTRRQVNRDRYGIAVNNEDEDKVQEEEESETSDTSDSEADNEEDDKEEEAPRSYYLREHKPRTNLYMIPIEPKRVLRKNIFERNAPQSPIRAKNLNNEEAYRSPAHRRTARDKSRKQFHSRSSSTSSSSNSSDEERFERRKAKSMAKSRNRCLPMNLNKEDLQSGVLRDRVKIGASLADIDPMNVDKSVDFNHVGGLGKHIHSLKEMIVFPLLYPEVFEKFKIAPPRGCLFYGPPGTGKTLVARALANECSTGDRKVSFFMRKGADCLSKWVGESERQLRLLFDQAYQMRPSIIFFDEIDGLAPVRSSRQDQIHSSIVSTLLALMDGLDNRGEVVVIGATNRLDSIDPALRRPGRFDREFLFPLPSVEARQQILQIHTKEWNPKLCDAFLGELAERCVGYCGADLKALCTEAALQALRRRYPQIYMSSDKLQLDVTTIEPSAKDFLRGMQKIVPASQRSVTSPGRALMPVVKPLLLDMFNTALSKLQRIFPCDAMGSMHNLNDTSMKMSLPKNGPTSSTKVSMEIYSDDEEDVRPIFESLGRGGRVRKRLDVEEEPQRPFLDFGLMAYHKPMTHRPRLLLTGKKGQGQSTHLGPAILHHMERLPVYILDLPSLYAVSAKTPEESCAQVFLEARRTSPSIIYMPHLSSWWEVIGETLRATFLSMINDVDSSTPILILATSEEDPSSLDTQLRNLFDERFGEIYHMSNPSVSARREFFQDLILLQTKKPPPQNKAGASRMLEALPKAAPTEPRKLNESELKKLRRQEENTMRELRLFLRDTLNKLGRDRKFGIFAKPVDIEDVPDYYEIIAKPMDLTSMMTKIDLHKYNSVKEFLNDIDLICSNALEYNPDKDPEGRAIRHRACALRDTSYAIIDNDLDPEFEKLCEEVLNARKKRGESGDDSVPNYYFTKPLDRPTAKKLGFEARSPVKVDGEVAENPTDARPFTRRTVQVQQEAREPFYRTIVRKIPIKTSTSSNFKKNVSPWCRTKKKRYRKVIFYVDEFGNEIQPPRKPNGELWIPGVGDNTDKDKETDSSNKECDNQISQDSMDPQSSQETNNLDHDKISADDKTIATSSISSRRTRSHSGTRGDVQPAQDEMHISDNEINSSKPKQASARTRLSSDFPANSPSLGVTTRHSKSLTNLENAHSTRSSMAFKAHSSKTSKQTSPENTSPSSRAASNSPGHAPGTSPSRASDTSPGRRLGTSPGRAANSSPRRSSEIASGCTHTSNDGRAMQSPIILSNPKCEPQTSEDKDTNPEIKIKSDKNNVDGTKSCLTQPLLNGSAISHELMETDDNGKSLSPPNTSNSVKVQSNLSSDVTHSKEKEKSTEEEVTPGLQHTRLQSSTTQQDWAQKILSAPTQKVIIDELRLGNLLNVLVKSTHQFSVDQLERLYSQISQCVYHYRLNYDKTDLVKELEDIAANLK